MFRRRSDNAPDLLDAEPEAGPPPAGGGRGGLTPAKGRPTPKRSEAEKSRRQPYVAPSDRKAAVQQDRVKSRAERARRNEAMRRGEEWALPRKDQGKVRGLVRDHVDARRSASEFYLFGVLVLFALLFIPALRGTLVVNYVVLAVLIVVIGEGWYTGRKAVRLVNQRYPGESTRGVRWYAALRSTQWRKLRMPPPRVKVGQRP